MSQLKKTPFQLTFLAAAVLSLSACTTTPTIGGIDLGRVGTGISKVGSKTAEIGSNAWEGTKNLLNIGPPESDLLDEVDLALMEEDADMEDVQVNALSSEPLLPQQPLEVSMAEAGESLSGAEMEEQTLAFGEIPDQAQPESDIVVMASYKEEAPASGETVTEGLLDEELLAKAEEATVPLTDLTYVVTENETLWVIAKSTTGDANNWHVIADINNLAPDASVYVGQKIVIPADMVKPEYSAVEVAVENEVVVAEAESNQPAAVSLQIPAKEEVVVAAAAEQIQPAKTQDAGSIMANATALKVGEGETLWDFAKRTTGDATNWKSIAEKNLLGEQQIASIRPGQKIYVPTDMVRSRDENGVLIAKGEEGNIPTATVGGVTPTNKAAIDASTAVLAGTNKPEDAEIKIVEAAYQDEKNITPVTAESLSKEAAMEVATNDKLGKVMVRGTYYPKAVYNEADFSSSLLMRVSPGTQLLVSKAIGPWLEVQTDKGVGYVHSRDIK